MNFPILAILCIIAATQIIRVDAQPPQACVFGFLCNSKPVVPGSSTPGSSTPSLPPGAIILGPGSYPCATACAISCPSICQVIPFEFPGLPGGFFSTCPTNCTTYGLDERVITGNEIPGYAQCLCPEECKPNAAQVNEAFQTIFPRTWYTGCGSLGSCCYFNEKSHRFQCNGIYHSGSEADGGTDDDTICEVGECYIIP